MLTQGSLKELKNDAEWGDKLEINHDTIIWMVKKNLFYSFWTSIDMIESDEFMLGNATWCLRFYPQGNGKENTGFFSLYLVLKKYNQQISNIAVNFTLQCQQTGHSMNFAHTFKKYDTLCGIDKLFESTVLKSQNLLTIKCMIQETLTRSDVKYNELNWKIDGYLLQIFKSYINTDDDNKHNDNKDDEKQEHEYHSPTFQTIEGVTWRIDCIPCTLESYFSIYLHPIQLPSDKTSIGINYSFEFIELKKTLKAGNTFSDKSIGWKKAFKSEDMHNLDVLNIRCKVQETMNTEIVSTADIIWNIDGDLLQQLKTAAFKESFISPLFNKNNAFWQIQIYPNGLTKIGHGVMRLCCYVIEGDKEISIRYKMQCDQIGYIYYNDRNGSKMSKGKVIDNEQGFDFKELCKLGDNEKLKIKCNIWTDVKLWRLKVKNVRYRSFHYIEFKLHGMEWELHADRGVIDLKLCAFPEMISGVTITRRIVCNDINLMDESMVSFCRDGDDDNISVKYDNKLLENLETLNIACYIEIISLKSLYCESAKIVFDPIISGKKVTCDKYKHSKPSNDDEKKDTLNVTECNKIFAKHNKNMESWNELNSKFEIYAESMNEDNDDEKKQNVERNGLKLFDEYVEYHQFINEQESRLKQASTHGVHLGEIQRILIKYMAQQTDLMMDTKKELDAVLNEYESTKQERLKLQQLVENTLNECNIVIAKENGLTASNINIKMKLSDIDKQMEELRETSKICTGLIDEYDKYIKRNKYKINEIKMKFERRWDLFESGWSEWKCDDIIGWFKYKTRQRNTDIIQWDMVKKNIMEQNIVGKTLNVMTENGLFTIGIHDYEIRNHLFNAITMLRSKYPSIKRKQENDYEIASKFKCELTKQIMKDPVIAFDGYTYERVAIEQYLKIHKKSPVTKEYAFTMALFPNDDLKQEIASFNVINKTIPDEGDQDTQYID